LFKFFNKRTFSTFLMIGLAKVNIYKQVYQQKQMC
jgi:hypothetical protein